MDEAHRLEVAAWLASLGHAEAALVEGLPAHQSDPGRSSRWRVAGGEEVWVEDTLTHPIGGFDAMPSPLDLRREAACLAAACGRLALPGLVPWRELRVDDDRALIAFVRPATAAPEPFVPSPAPAVGRALAALAEAIDRAAEVLPYGLCVAPTSLARSADGFLAAGAWGLESLRRLRLSRDPETQLVSAADMAALFAGIRAGKQPLDAQGPVARVAPRVAFVRLWLAMRYGHEARFLEDFAPLPPAEARVVRDALAGPVASGEVSALLRRLVRAG